MIEFQNNGVVDVSKMTYSEFCEYVDGEGFDRFEQILGYEGFEVYFDSACEKYYYLEGGVNDASDFFEVEPIACLTYSIANDLRLDKDKCGEIMGEAFDCVCCGEYVYDDGIEYLWFDRPKQITCRATKEEQ